jgi:hypothetical protein
MRFFEGERENESLSVRLVQPSARTSRLHRLVELNVLRNLDQMLASHSSNSGSSLVRVCQAAL